MKIVFLDAGTIGSDMDLSGFSRYGELVLYDNSTAEEAAERAVDADVLMVNKVPVNEKTIGKALGLKLVLETATGVNNLDLDYLKERGIEWRNAAGYSTESVAQHTFALLFYLLENMYTYDRYVKSGDYSRSGNFTLVDPPYRELAGKTWGIIGLGTIGRRVADIASAFGVHVIYASASGRPPQEGYSQVSLDELYERSDIISVHAPLNQYTEHLIDQEAFRKMKNDCIFLNLGRGPIIVEKDLLWALNNHQIGGAGLDVLDAEPMREDCPFYQYQNSSRLVITPHVAWASVEARKRLMDIILNHLKDFVE